MVAEFGVRVAERDELIDLDFEVGQAGVEQAADVLTRGLAVVANIEDLADLGERQSGGLAAVDEADAITSGV